jgi:HK97 family phage major capsid protein/HK97 family phage prohead protease
MTAPARALPSRLCQRAVEFRATMPTEGGSTGDGRTLEGYAAVFDAPTEICEWYATFTEVMAKGAFTRSISQRMPVLQFDHGRDARTGTVPIGAISDLREDAEGLFVSARLYPNEVVEPIRQAIEGQSITGMSFRFRVIRDKWTDPDGNVLSGDDLLEALFEGGDGMTRTILEADVLELGPVVFPAYETTSVSVRSMLAEMTEEERRKLMRELADELRQSSAPVPVDTAPAAEPEQAEAPEEIRELPAQDAPPAPPQAPAEPSGTAATPPATTTERDVMSFMTVEERAARQDEIRARLEAINTEHDGNELPDEARTEWDTLSAEMAGHVKVIAAADERRSQLAALAATQPGERAVETTAATARTFNAPNVNLNPDPFAKLNELRFTSRDDDDVLARAVTALSDKKYRPRYVTDEAVQNAVRAVERIPGAAHHALVHGSPTYVRGYKAYMESQGQNTVYEADMAEGIRTSLSLTGANGGYTLPTWFDPTLIYTGTAVRNPIREISSVRTITQNVWHGVTVGNVTAYWTAEGAALTDGNPTFSNPSITAAKLTVYLPGSYEVFEDSVLQGELPALMNEGAGFVESTAFVSGSGSGAPKGIITAISATAGSTVTATTRGAFTAASSADVFKVLNAVPSRFEDSATWVANKATFNTIRTMSSTGGQGSLYWTNLNDNVLGQPSLLGSPTRNSSDFSAATTSGTVLAVLGDFSRFLIVDRVGMSVEWMPNVVDGSGLPTGQRAIVAHKRVGSDCVDVNAFRFLFT